jgi:ABC-type nitrate/sulfonate/bicarbonate transport system ATPase subunit
LLDARLSSSVPFAAGLREIVPAGEPIRADEGVDTGVTESAPPATATAIDFGSISKSFIRPGAKPLEVLRRVSFVVPRGAVVAILGPSGCGKSTLLNMAAGLIAPDSGSVAVMSQDVVSGNVDWSRLGYMFQDDRLLPWRSARQNVALALETGKMASRERMARAEAALGLVELAGFADAYPHELSGGMRSRVALARSLVGEPNILLMDEPFSRLDAQTRSAMHRELLRIQALRHMTILFVTHEIEEAVVLADQIIVMAPRPGRIRTEVPVTIPQPRIGAAATTALVNELRASLGEAEPALESNA